MMEVLGIVSLATGVAGLCLWLMTRRAEKIEVRLPNYLAAAFLETLGDEWKRSHLVTPSGKPEGTGREVAA
jgi:hypothetical protein